MTSRDFAYWLQGFFEIENPTNINEAKVEMIKNHLNMVFAHEIDPSMGDEKEQTKLDKIHSPPINSGWRPGRQPDGTIARC